jgi:hypothetical protein
MTTQISSGFATAASTAGDVAGVVRDLQTAINPATTALLAVYFSAKYPAAELAAAIKAAYPGVPVVGCTTAGELTNKGFTENGVAAVGLDKQVIKRVAIAVAEKCDADAAPIKSALKKLADDFKVDINGLDGTTYLGLVYTDGNSGHEEFVMDTLAAEAFNMTFVGGSAGDDLAFKQAFVIADGKAYSHTAVLALLETTKPFTILKTQSFKTTGKTFTVTKADVANRVVHEFDGKPAAQAYAEALGVPVEKIADKFMSNPIGLLVGSVPFVRSPQQREGDKAIKFYCQVTEGSRVHLLAATDMVADTKRDIEATKAKLGSLSGMLVFNCILRYLDAKNQGIVDKLGSCYSVVPAAGFNTYGEQYLGHINQTATIVCFA